MLTEKITVSKEEAAKLYQQYKSHAHYDTPYNEQLDFEIRRTYQLLSKGNVVIRALESIKQNGLNRELLPKLAFTVASAKECYLTRYRDGQISMTPQEGWRRGKKAHNVFLRESTFNFPAESFPMTFDGRNRQGRSEHKAQVPLIPAHLRPKRGLENYHILWEAEWKPEPPHDPYLLRRIGKADLWLVVAHWDLTEVERAALATRV